VVYREDEPREEPPRDLLVPPRERLLLERDPSPIELPRRPMLLLLLLLLLLRLRPFFCEFDLGI